MTRRIGILIILAASFGVMYAANAQNPQSAPPTVQTPPLASPSSPQPVPEKIAPPDRDQAANDGKTLSDRLSEQRGTLRPPNVDPGINKPIPLQGQGTMPVIPPPGTPGGNPSVVPK